MCCIPNFNLCVWITPSSLSQLSGWARPRVTFRLSSVHCLRFKVCCRCRSDLEVNSGRCWEFKIWICLLKFWVFLKFKNIGILEFIQASFVHNLLYSKFFWAVWPCKKLVFRWGYELEKNHGKIMVRVEFINPEKESCVLLSPDLVALVWIFAQYILLAQVSLD